MRVPLGQKGEVLPADWKSNLGRFCQCHGGHRKGRGFCLFAPACFPLLIITLLVFGQKCFLSSFQGIGLDLEGLGNGRSGNIQAETLPMAKNNSTMKGRLVPGGCGKCCQTTTKLWTQPKYGLQNASLKKQEFFHNRLLDWTDPQEQPAGKGKSKRAATLEMQENPVNPRVAISAMAWECHCCVFFYGPFGQCARGEDAPTTNLSLLPPLGPSLLVQVGQSRKAESGGKSRPLSCDIFGIGCALAHWHSLWNNWLLPYWNYFVSEFNQLAWTLFE